VRPLLTADFSDIHNALGPDERLLAVLHGSDDRGPANWVITSRRLLMLGQTHPDSSVAHVMHAAITCVEMRADPLGTSLRVRATGRQLHLHTLDAAQAAQFCSLLRERAGLGTPALGTPAITPAISPAQTRRATDRMPAVRLAAR
jgi:hypothetical protein